MAKAKQQSLMIKKTIRKRLEPLKFKKNEKKITEVAKYKTVLGLISSQGQCIKERVFDCLKESEAIEKLCVTNVGSQAGAYIVFKRPLPVFDAARFLEEAVDDTSATVCVEPTSTLCVQTLTYEDWQPLTINIDERDLWFTCRLWRWASTCKSFSVLDPFVAENCFMYNYIHDFWKLVNDVK
jgi:hypothetical protein